MATASGDLTSRDDVIRLVDECYERVRSDERLGPIFADIARVDWNAHLPKMYDFWEAVLFGTTTFKGNPLEVHRSLARLTTMSADEFGRWLDLFRASVDALFHGEMAEEAKQRAARIAGVMQHHIDTDAMRAKGW